MRSAERPLTEPRRVETRRAHRGDGAATSKRFVVRQRRQEGPADAAPSMLLRRAWRPDHEQAMGTGGGDDERTLRERLAAHIREIQAPGCPWWRTGIMCGDTRLRA